MTLLLVALTLLTPAERDSLLADTPGNSDFWGETMSSYRGEVLEAVEYLFGSIPRLDRLEMNSEALMDHVIGALESRADWYDSIPTDVFLPALVQYRIDEEPVTAYRTPLQTHWLQRLGEADTTCATVASRIAWAVSSMRCRPYDILGGVSSPRDVLSSGGGTPVELRVLLGSSLRSMGIPVRSVMGWFQGEAGREGGWLEYWDGAGWTPVMLPSDSIPEGFAGLSLAVAGDEYITAQRTATGSIALEPVSAASDSILVAISIPCPGRYMALDWVELDPAAPCSLEVGQGSYCVHLSRRLPSGGVRFVTSTIDVGPGETVSVRLSDMEAAF